MNRYNELSKDTQAGVDALINSLASNLDYRDQMLSAAVWAAKEVERSMDDMPPEARIEISDTDTFQDRWTLNGFINHGR